MSCSQLRHFLSAIAEQDSQLVDFLSTPAVPHSHLKLFLFVPIVPCSHLRRFLSAPVVPCSQLAVFLSRGSAHSSQLAIFLSAPAMPPHGPDIPPPDPYADASIRSSSAYCWWFWRAPVIGRPTTLVIGASNAQTTAYGGVVPWRTTNNAIFAAREASDPPTTPVVGEPHASACPSM